MVSSVCNLSWTEVAEQEELRGWECFQVRYKRRFSLEKEREGERERGGMRVGFIAVR